MSAGAFSRRFPLIAFVIFAVMSVAAFFLTQEVKAARPVVWQKDPRPRPATFDPVGGVRCVVAGRSVDYRRTYLELSPTTSGRVAVYVYPLNGDLATTTIAAGRFMRAVPFARSHSGSHRFYWNGRESDGKLAPPGRYIFRFVLADLGDHAVDLTGSPIRLITSAHPPEHGCFHGRQYR